MTHDRLDLLDYRRRVAEMYQFIRERGTDALQALTHFRQTRDDLFRTHPQSPLDDDQKANFAGLRYFDYDPAFRVVARVDGAVEPRVSELELGDDGPLSIRQFGQVSFELPTGAGTLALFLL
jgi:uncharacterized protein (DUF1684 family)